MSTYLCDAAPLTCPRHPSPVGVCDGLGDDRLLYGIRHDAVIGQEVDKAMPLTPFDLENYIERAINPGTVQVNRTLLRDVMTFLRDNPARWCQHVYLAYRGGMRIGCIGGWAVVFAGLTVGSGSIHRTAQLALGLTNEQACALFGFVSVVDAITGKSRHPTFQELVDLVKQVTGFRFQPQEEA